ncbi:hypothetical protein EDC01DRAFT_632556 [Geopyxis carbonaria]|nr:hypothetical protein EDC01DRAFT_632556 [Geopyxis carbonaria]
MPAINDDISDLERDSAFYTYDPVPGMMHTAYETTPGVSASTSHAPGPAPGFAPGFVFPARPAPVYYPAGVSSLDHFTSRGHHARGPAPGPVLPARPAPAYYPGGVSLRHAAILAAEMAAQVAKQHAAEAERRPISLAAALATIEPTCAEQCVPMWRDVEIVVPAPVAKDTEAAKWRKQFMGYVLWAMAIAVMVAAPGLMVAGIALGMNKAGAPKWAVALATFGVFPVVGGMVFAVVAARVRVAAAGGVGGIWRKWRTGGEEGGEERDLERGERKEEGWREGWAE